MDFRGYYGKNKTKATTVRQRIVRKDNRLSCRLSDDTWNEIDEFTEDMGIKNLSAVIETLLSDSLLNYKIAKQKYELEGI